MDEKLICTTYYHNEYHTWADTIQAVFLKHFLLAEKSIEDQEIIQIKIIHKELTLGTEAQLINALLE